MQVSDKQRKAFRNKYGPWAIVTGASSGIGSAISEALAALGLNLVINARDEKRLLQSAVKLRSVYKIEVRELAGDLADPVTIDKLTRITSQLDTGLLVLSAGYGTSGLFLNASLHNEIDMLRVNCEAVLSLAHYYSQRFAEQKRGGIIFLSSIVAFQGVPYAAHYAATKAYIQSLAEGLCTELKEHNIDVLAAAPGPVESGFGKRANMKMGNAIQPGKIALPILLSLGRRRTVFPGAFTKLLVYSLQTLPRAGKIGIMKKVMGGMTRHQWK